MYPHRAWDPGLDPQAGRGYGQPQPGVWPVIGRVATFGGSVFCQEPKTRYVIDGHDVCLDGRLAISHGDCVLDETVTFSDF